MYMYSRHIIKEELSIFLQLFLWYFTEIMTTHGLSMPFNLNLSFKQIRKKREIREVNKSIEKFKY